MPPPPTDDDRRSAADAARWLRRGVAFVWLWTGLAVLHPYYRELGTAYLAPLGLPPWVMYATCAAEVLLGLRVALGRAATWVTVLQIVMIAGFTAILSVFHPALWIDPIGVLTKNLVLIVMIGTAWLLEREGWSRRAEHLLRFGLALFWTLDGVLLVTGGGRFIWFGWEIVVGPLICFNAGAVMFSLLGSAALVLVGSVARSEQWFHPFGPLTKDVAIVVASTVAVGRLLSLRRHAPR
jgi:DoxX-like family